MMSSNTTTHNQNNEEQYDKTTPNKSQLHYGQRVALGVQLLLWSSASVASAGGCHRSLASPRLRRLRHAPCDGTRRLPRVFDVLPRSGTVWAITDMACPQRPASVGPIMKRMRIMDIRMRRLIIVITMMMMSLMKNVCQYWYVALNT